MNALTDAHASYQASAQTRRAHPAVRPANDEERSAPLRTAAMACYIVSIVGLLFSGGLLSFCALIGAYLQRGASRGTSYESHFNWMIRTSWITLGVAALAFAPMLIGFFLTFLSAGTELSMSAGMDAGEAPLASLGVSLVWLGWLIAIPLGMGASVWYLYRMIKGLLRANDKQPI